MEDENIFKKQPWKEYLLKDFGGELNYKLWSTKGTRFCAHRRFKKKNILSMYSIGFLSAYIIIFNLFAFLPTTSAFYIEPNILTMITISLSIIVLVFSQLEIANNYSLTADRFHKCARDIAKLYNEWRYVKTHVDDEAEKKNAIISITKKYEDVLDNYDNHEDIDYQLFKTKHPDYYHLTRFDIILANCKYYLKVQLIYHALIAIPLILFLISLYTKSTE